MPLRRYTPLKRSKPLLRKQSVVSSGRNTSKCTKEKRKPIEKISSGRKEQLKIYGKLRPVFLSIFTKCGAKLNGCTHQATEIHHKKGRQGILLLIIKYFLPVCRNCHDRIGVHSKEAIEMGLSVSRNKTDQQESRYLRPNSIDTIRVLLRSGVKLSIIS